MSAKSIILLIIIASYVYSQYLIHFEKVYIDETGNIISKEDWDNLKRCDKLYH